jgi:ribonuclease HI
MDTVHLYTDGACKGNPGPGGWAYLNKQTKELKRGGEPHTTNNRMELTAILRALESVPEGSDVTIYTDSKLCIGWVAKGWRRNVPAVDEIVREIIALVDLKSLNVTMQHVKGHSGDIYNGSVDSAAQTTADEIARSQLCH